MILDTNAYSALARRMPSVVAGVSQANNLALPLPVVAELRYGFALGSQTDQNEAILERFLAQPQASVLVPTIETTRYYAALQKHCREQGKALSHNDIWIAALAQEASDQLLTFDRDFEVFQDILGSQLLILSDS